MNTSPNDWAMIESLLFCFYSIVESCEAEGDFILPVVQILPKLDMKNPYLADTCMYTVGALAEWLMDRVEFLPVLLPIVMPGLQVANSSTLGFFLIPTLSGFEILDDLTLIIQNWQLSRLETFWQ